MLIIKWAKMSVFDYFLSLVGLEEEEEVICGGDSLLI